MQVRRVPPDDARLGPLFADLAVEYERRYGPNDELEAAPLEDFAPPHGAFVVMLDDEGVVVAGGALRRLDERTGEVKRMWTARHRRRQGLARRVLAALEDTARELGYARLRLETGHEQPEAMALYSGLGYRRIGPYGRYDQAVAYERDLEPPATAEPA